MLEPSAPAVPLATLDCPLCGGANACAAAISGSFETPCWCRQATFAPALLARVPEAQRGQACICQGCASAARPVGGERTP